LVSEFARVGTYLKVGLNPNKIGLSEIRPPFGTFLNY